MFKRNRKKFLNRKKRRQNDNPSEPVLKNPREIQIMREAGRIVARVHAALKETIKPGVSTWELDQLSLEILTRYNATSCFLGYRGFPAHVCISLNEELVHGIPSKHRVLKEGDIITIDVGARYRGFVGDSAWSYAVGEIDERSSQLMRVTEESLYKGIEKARVGNKIEDVSRAIQKHVENADMYIVRGYTGHGVGRRMHEAPQVLNYVSDEDGDRNQLLKPGMVLAVEPMVQWGTAETETLTDNWTVISRDYSPAAHFEHTVAVTHQGPEILTLP